MISVLDKNGKKVPVSGQDASPPGLQNILLGKQVATVYKPFQLEAQASVDLAMKLLNGEKPTVRQEDRRRHAVHPADARSWSTAKNMKMCSTTATRRSPTSAPERSQHACQKAGLKLDQRAGWDRTRWSLVAWSCAQAVRSDHQTLARRQ